MKKASNTMAPMTAALARTQRTPQPFEVKGVPKSVHQPKAPHFNQPKVMKQVNSVGPTPPQVKLK